MIAVFSGKRTVTGGSVLRQRCRPDTGSGMQSKLKHLAVWMAELVATDLLGAILLLAAAGWPMDGLARSFLAGLVGIVIFFFVESGYLITVGLAAYSFRRSIPWLYPVIAAVLFVPHYVYRFNRGPGDVVVIPGGALIIFACSYAGGWWLRKWCRVVPPVNT